MCGNNRFVMHRIAEQRALRAMSSIIMVQLVDSRASTADKEKGTLTVHVVLRRAGRTVEGDTLQHDSHVADRGSSGFLRICDHNSSSKTGSRQET